MRSNAAATPVHFKSQTLPGLEQAWSTLFWAAFMKRKIRILSIVLVATGTLAWLGLGANLSWTRTSVPVKTVDPVTKIEGIDYRKQFVPGLDFLGGTFLGAGFLVGASFLFSSEKSNHIEHEKKNL
jgi:hypothetical protein